MRQLLPKDLSEVKAVVEDLVSRWFPEGATVLLLSHTGSRAYGWGSENLDWDIHGCYYVRGGWFDWVHSGERGIDLNLWDLEHVYRYTRWQSFEMYINYSQPILVAKEFRYDRWRKLFKAVNTVSGARKDIERQVVMYEMDRQNPRTALHAYRLVLLGLLMLEKGRIDAEDIDVVRLAESRYGTKLPKKLAILYRRHGRVPEKLAREVITELRGFLARIDEVLGSSEAVGREELDDEVSEWYLDVLADLEG